MQDSSNFRISLRECPRWASIRTTGGIPVNMHYLCLKATSVSLFNICLGISRALVHPENFLREVNMNAKVVLWGGGKRQSWQKEALMIAATTGIGTAVGAIAGGKKGATIGAISGGVARFIMRMVNW